MLKSIKRMLQLKESVVKKPESKPQGLVIQASPNIQQKNCLNNTRLVTVLSILLINPSVFLKYSPMFLRPNCWTFCAMNCRCIEIFKMVGDGTFKAGNISNQSTPGRQKKRKKIEYETQVYPDPRCIGFLFPRYQMAHLVRITFSV